VGVIYSGVPQFYVRETEQKRGEQWVAVPLFDPNVPQAAVFSEAAAKAFVTRLRSMRVDAWVEDARDGRRIEVTHESQQFSEDNRVPMRASLDDINFFAVYPANTMEGKRWFLRCAVPGRPTQDTIYSETILGALQRAQDLNFLQHGERAPAPEPQPASPIRSAPTWRRRTGDLR
jgi:hypothetical protein